MIVAISRAEPQQTNAFYIPRATSAASADAPDWFKAGDFNGDGDVSRREFLGTDEQFQRLDQDDDGFIHVDEATALVQ